MAVLECDMGKFSMMDALLKEYEESLNSYGHGDPLTISLKRELLSYKSDELYDIVCGIDMEFDMMVFNNQCEGRF
jgi:hypothetical protein